MRFREKSTEEYTRGRAHRARPPALAVDPLGLYEIKPLTLPRPPGNSTSHRTRWSADRVK
jgi:hypothetical protein